MKTTRRRLLWLACGLTLVFSVCGVDMLLADFEPPPPPKPHRRKAGESFPPLPLPVTPLRRTEKKRPPEPPALIGKLQYGTRIWKTTADGRRYSYFDWQGDTTDAHNLVKEANRLLNIRYRWVHTKLSDFSFTPAELPILYITGHQPFAFTDKEIQKMRWYIRDGGMLMMSPCCGSNAFKNAAYTEMKKLFPQRPLRPITPDHPVYSCFYKIKTVKSRDTGEPWKEIDPPVRGITLGCRLAVVLHENDVCCGWAGHTHPKGLRIERIVSQGHASPPGFWYDQDEHEWVVVLQGSATIQLEGDSEPMNLQAGAYLNIPVHARHRVVSTSPTEKTIWLAISYSD